VERSQDTPRFALCTISHREKLLEYVLDVAKELGFDGVELWGREPHISEKFDENRVQAARKMIEERGLQLCCLGSYVVFGPVRTRAEELVDLDDTLYTARCLRAPLVRIWASDIASAKATRKQWDQTASEIQEACDRAARLSLVVAAEMHDDTLTDTADASLRLLEQVNRANFKLNFEVSHRPVEEPPRERLLRVLDHVVHLHLRNFSTYAGENGERANWAPISDGLVDYYPLLDTLAEHGYAGYYALEFACREGNGKRESLAQDLAYLKSLFKLMGRAA
jgi:sugar phosphate isomerase/epimerase